MKRLLAAVLSLALLSGCGAAPAQKKNKTSADLGVYASAAGLSPTAELLRVDGQPVTAGQYLYWLADACGRIEKYYGGKADWTSLRDGQTLSEYAADQALRTAKFCAVVEKKAGKSGCVLTDDERRSVAARAKRRAAALGMDKTTARKFCEDSRLYGKLYRKFCTRGSGINPAQTALDKFAAAQKLTAEDAWAAYFDAWLERAAERARVEKCPAYQKVDASAFYTKLCTLRTEKKRDKKPRSSGT